MAKDSGLSRRDLLRAASALALLGACEGPPDSEVNAAHTHHADGGAADAGGVAGPVDAGADAGAPDSGSGTGASDAGVDAGAPDSGPGTTTADAGAADAGVPVNYTAPIPNITPNGQHYITSCCGTPLLDPSTWRIDIVANGDELGTLTLARLRALISRDKEHTLECISASPFNLAISNAIWTGLPLKEIFAAIGVTVPPGAEYMKFSCADGYTTALPVSDLDLPVWLVWEMNGEEIPPKHGYPARLLVPGKYGMKNPKWIQSIEFIDTSYLGFWEQRFYPDDAPYQINALILEPKGAAQLSVGSVTVRGAAYAGRDPVVSVECSVDGGAWQPATIENQPGPDVWAVWSFPWVATAGSHTVQARCHTQSGATSDPSIRLMSLHGFAGSMQIVVQVI